MSAASSCWSAFSFPAARPRRAGLPIRRWRIADKGPGFDPFFNGQTLWIIGMIFLITSSLLGAVNFITTIIQLRAKGLTWMRLPFFVWAQFVTAFLLLLAFPPLEAAIVMQLMDRVGRDQLLPADRPGGERRGRAHQRRRQPACCGSICSGSSGIPKFTC